MSQVQTVNLPQPRNSFKQLTDISQIPDTGKRLRRLRLDRGYKSMRSLCEAMGVNLNGYNQHENGIRGLGVETALVYARFFDVSASWLLFGEQARATPMVLIVGSVGQGGWVNHARYKTAGSAEVGDYRLEILARRKPAGHYRSPRFAHAPPGVTREAALDMAAVEVLTDDLSPHYCRGDVLFYQPVALDAEVAHVTVDNRRCMVLTSHDELRPGVVHVGEDNTVLLSASGPGYDRTDMGSPKAVWPITGIMCRASLFA
jgi:transcriptional regulator with XRE-family HTH domain